jgi:hypothetical protein
VKYDGKRGKGGLDEKSVQGAKSLHQYFSFCGDAGKTEEDDLTDKVLSWIDSAGDSVEKPRFQ